jgi:uncharacterized RDD family membrane protein YckC
MAAGYGGGTPNRAGFGARLGGFIIDQLLYGLLAAVFAVPGILMIIGSVADCVTVEVDDTVSEIICPPGSPKAGLLVGGIGLILLGVLIVVFLYVRALGRTGQTWGRKIVGVKVVDKMSGQPIGVGKAFGRALFEQFISGALCYLGFLWMLWDNDKQTWHDKVVDSVVVKV